jgi:hypothetical protein
VTELQIMRARALNGASLGGNERAKMFVRQMARMAETHPNRDMTERQVGYLKGLCWTYRRQIPAALAPSQNPYDAQLWTETEEDPASGEDARAATMEEFL